MIPLVFFGTPDFAVPSLKALSQASFLQVKAVVTQPDRPSGRKKNLKAPSIKVLAQDLALPVIQEEDIQSPSFSKKIKEMNVDLLVVVAYGQILSLDLLSLPRYGSVNLHASLLPKFRGAAPIQWAIIQGLSKTGVTTMLLDEGMDSGDILLQERMRIDSNATAGDLMDGLSILGAKLLIKTLQSIKEGSLKPIPQDESEVSYAPMLSSKDTCISWEASSSSIHNLIRGTNPYPGAYTYYQGKRVKVWKSQIQKEKTSFPPGTLLSVKGDLLCCATGDGVVGLQVLQPEGRKRMSGQEFFHGYSSPFDTFGFPEDCSL